MTLQSTRRLRVWRRTWVAAAVLALCVACSGSSDGKAKPRPSTTTTPRVTPPTRGTAPPTRGTTPSGPHAKVVFVPSYIDFTGKADVTKPLQAFLDRVKNGRVVRFHRDGRYRSEGTLKIGNRRNLTFEGQGATLFASKRGARDRTQFWIKRGSNIVVRDLIVRGAHPNGGTSKGAYVRKLEIQHGFKIEGVQGVELDHVEVTDVYGDFVYVTRDLAKRTPSTNVWIHDSTFRRNGRQGVAVVAATNVIIERNHFDHTRRSTIDLEPNARSWRISNVFVLNNTVGKGRLLFVASHGQGPVDNVVISGNQLHGHDLTIDAMPPGKERRSNWIVKNNVSDTTVHHRPMRFFGIDGLVVTGNTQRVSNREPGVVMTDDCGTHVAGNEFGAGGVQTHGETCAAVLAVPKAPVIRGRNGSSTPTTGPPVTTPGSPNPPGSTTPGSAPAPSGGSGSGGDRGLVGWAALAGGVCLLASVLALLRARRR